MELKVERLSKVYEKKKALDDVSFTLEEGVYGLLGPNGAGKSTLMNLITTNLKPTSGKIYWNDQPLEHVKQEFRDVLGYMPQQQVMYPGFTAAEYLSYIASLHGMAKEEARRRIPLVLNQMSLADVAGKKIKTFSGGMRQRLLLAQAVLTEPRILILDEPTAGLDPYQRLEVGSLIAEMSADRIILIATHVVQDIELISREILLMKEGKLIRKGSSAELCRELEGQLFEIRAPIEDARQIMTNRKVYGIRELGGGMLGIRICANEPPNGVSCISTTPTLEDVYLYCMGGNWNGCSSSF